MTTVRKALAFSVSQRFLNFAIQLGSTIVISRLITPAQTGVFSLAVGLVAIAQMFRDFGVGEFLLQEKDLTPDLLRAAFTIALTLGWSIGFILLLLAEPAAAFYREPVVADVIRILSISFFLVPLGYVANALLTRTMRFDLLLIAQTVSTVLGTALSILLAWMGYGSIGLAWAMVSGVALNVVMIAFIRPRETLYWPLWSGWSRIGQFGFYKTACFLLEQFSRRAPDFFIARTLGFAASGLYSRANGFAGTFSDFVMGAVYRVAMPSFAKLKNDGHSLGQAYLDANRLLACLPLSFFSFAALYAEPIVLLLFGDQWHGAIAPMRWLAAGGVLATPIMLAAPLLTAGGAVHGLLRAQILASPVQVIIVALASMHSIEAVAAMGLLACVLLNVLFHREVQKLTGVRPAELAQAIWPSLIVAAVALPLPALYLICAQYLHLSIFLIAVGGGALYLLCWLTSLYLLKHPYRSECGKMLQQIGLLKAS